jgi:alpha-galactosidase
VFNATPPKSLAANISSAETVKLVVTDGGDNIEFDHGDWADPMIDCA